MQNSQKYCCIRVSFLNKVAGLIPPNLLKKDSGVFLGICVIFKNIFFTEHLLANASFQYFLYTCCFFLTQFCLIFKYSRNEQKQLVWGVLKSSVSEAFCAKFCKKTPALGAFPISIMSQSAGLQLYLKRSPFFLVDFVIFLEQLSHRKLPVECSEMSSHHKSWLYFHPMVGV